MTQEIFNEIIAKLEAGGKPIIEKDGVTLLLKKNPWRTKPIIVHSLYKPREYREIFAFKNEDKLFEGILKIEFAKNVVFNNSGVESTKEQWRFIQKFDLL